MQAAIKQEKSELCLKVDFLCFVVFAYFLSYRHTGNINGINESKQMC